MLSERIYRGHIPCVRFLAAFIAGLGFGYYFDINTPLYIVIVGCAILSFVAFILLFVIAHYREGNFSIMPGILMFLGIFFLAWMLLWQSNPIIQEAHFSNHKAEVLIGVIDNEPQEKERYERFILKVKKLIYNGKELNTSGFLLVNLKADTGNDILEYGDKVLIASNYQRISPAYNPNEFSYGAFLANKDIWHSTFLEPYQYQKVGKKKGNMLVQAAILLRGRMLRKFEKYIIDKNALAIASTLILGYRNDMEQEIVDTFSATGTIHVLSVSGLHVGIVFLVFSGLLYWMNVHPKLRILKYAFLILFIWSYALITGFSPSVLRAAIMISFALMAFQFMHNGNSYNTIAASALFLLLYNPKFIADVGFQLSYLAVIAIVFLYPKIKAILVLKNKVLNGLWSYVALSLAAQMITFPLVIYYFHNFPSYFLPANLFVIIPATLIVYLGFILLLIPSGIGAIFVGNILEMLIVFMNQVLAVFANLPYAQLSGLFLNLWQTALVYCFLLTIIFAFIFKKKQLLYGSCASVMLLLAVELREFINRYDIQEIRFYNVRRNMAIAIFNQDKTILYSDSLTRESKRFRYAVAADLEAMTRLAKTTFVHLSGLYQSPNLIIKDNLIQFGDRRILVYTSIIENENRTNVDILYIRKNPSESLKTILKKIKCKQLLLDGSNSDKRIKDYVKEARKLSIPVYVLKNNFAYVW